MKTTITVNEDVATDLMLLKISCKAKNLNDVIQKLIANYKIKVELNRRPKKPRDAHNYLYAEPGSKEEHILDDVLGGKRKWID